jgi:putative ABC transport system substrate-binding protein
MVKPRRVARCGALNTTAWILAVGALAFFGCAETKTPSLAPKSVKLARTHKLAVIRLGNPAIAEPPDSDIEAGVKYAGVDASSFALVRYDAKGDVAGVPRLVQAAAGDGADLLIALLPETAVAAAANDRGIPVVFQMTGNPFALGLGTSDAQHQANVTGAYTTFHESVIVDIARGCLPKARKFGVLYNPDDRYSVIHKNETLRVNWYQVEPVTAEFHSEKEVPAAVHALIAKKAEGIILVTGIGEAARAAITEAQKAKVPVLGFREDHARAGAIVAREPSLRWGGFEAGRRAGRILQGEPPAKVSFIQGVDYITYVNTATAKQLGVTLFAALMRTARVVSSE